MPSSASRCKLTKNYQEAVNERAWANRGSLLGITKPGFKNGTISPPLRELLGCRLSVVTPPEADRKLLAARALVDHAIFGRAAFSCQLVVVGCHLNRDDSS